MKNHYADLETRSIISLSPPGDHYPSWTINRISVLPQHRGKSIASILLDQVCADADNENVTLYLEVQPDMSATGLTYDQLTAFYSRRGFKFFNAWAMKRKPQR